MAAENPAPPSPEDLLVGVEAGKVMVRAPGLPAFALSPEAAARAAERLWEAADQARGAPRPRPPFPPSELVSPHGAG